LCPVYTQMVALHIDNYIILDYNSNI